MCAILSATPNQSARGVRAARGVSAHEEDTKVRHSRSPRVRPRARLWGEGGVRGQRTADRHHVMVGAVVLRFVSHTSAPRPMVLHVNNRLRLVRP